MTNLKGGECDHMLAMPRSLQTGGQSLASFVIEVLGLAHGDGARRDPDHVLTLPHSFQFGAHPFGNVRSSISLKA